MTIRYSVCPVINRPPKKPTIAYYISTLESELDGVSILARGFSSLCPLVIRWVGGVVGYRICLTSSSGEISFAQKILSSNLGRLMDGVMVFIPINIGPGQLG